MERLTARDGEFVKWKGRPLYMMGAADIYTMAERLAAYEDTGLYPESVEALKLSMMGKAISEITEFDGLPIARLRELAEADEDGRVIILPCKVYETDGVRVYEHTVREAIYETAGGPAFDKNAIGKSIFLTREEAERALEEREGKKDGV